jgi:proline iminopeptidase
MSRHVDVSDTRLHVVERGGDGLPLLVVHGGPGLDHHEFGDYLDPLGYDVHLVFVDLRSQGLSDPAPPETWTVARMAADLSELAAALGFERYATLAHSYGAFVVLQHAVDFAGEPAATIASSGLPSARFLAAVQDNLGRLRAGRAARAGDDVVGARGRGADAGGVRGAAALAVAEYGGIELEDRLGDITHPVLVLAGRHDRTCVVEGGEAIAAGIPGAQLAIFEASARRTFAEENDAYLSAVRRFLQSVP